MDSNIASDSDAEPLDSEHPESAQMRVASATALAFDAAIEEEDWASLAEQVGRCESANHYLLQPEYFAKRAFLMACQLGRVQMVRTFLIRQWSDVEDATKSGCNGLHFAAKSGHVDILSILVSGGARLNTADRGGHTAIYVASCFGQTDCVRFLASKGASLEIPDNAGYRPLSIAAAHGKLETARALLQLGAEIAPADQPTWALAEPVSRRVSQTHGGRLPWLLQDCIAMGSYREFRRERRMILIGLRKLMMAGRARMTGASPGVMRVFSQPGLPTECVHSIVKYWFG